jgi:hypothetical protein
VGAYRAINNKYGPSDQNVEYGKSYGEKAEGNTQIAIWNEPGVSITMYFPYKDILDRWKGLSMTAFEDPNFKKRKAEKENQKTQQANKDLEEDTAYAGGMGQGGNAGQSYRKFKPKSAGTFTEDELDEACWKGYHKEGNKKMFGKTYPNCVKNTNEEEQLDEKCWDSHKQVGMKNKGGRQVPNCVPKESSIMKGILGRD